MCENNDLIYYQRSRDLIINKAKYFYRNNKERLRDQARHKYRNLFEEEKKEENVEEYVGRKEKKTERISKKLLQGKKVSI